ncbi:hypothetical protein, partial [Burkholderia glumae]
MYQQTAAYCEPQRSRCGQAMNMAEASYYIQHVRVTSVFFKIRYVVLHEIGDVRHCIRSVGYFARSAGAGRQTAYVEVQRAARP